MADQPTDDQAADPAEDQKAKFREALERKSQGSYRTASGGTSGTTGAHGEHSAEGGKRQFRRKSGG